MTDNRAATNNWATLTLQESALEAERQLDAALRGAPVVLRPYTSHLALGRGKLLRATALLRCAMGEDGAVHMDAPRFAAAVELFHLATLVHDDVIDDADSRRGIPTLHRLYNRRTAVLCGDYLLSAALALAAGAQDRDRYLQQTLPNYMTRVCAGEILQQENNWNLDLTLPGYLRIIRGKTAALFEGAYRAGAVLSERREARMRDYARLGRYVGMIFQLTDDCLDYASDEATAKKPVESDYEQGVVTLPLIRALALDPELKRRAALRQADSAEVGRLVRRRGGVTYTRLLARRYYDKAVLTLDGLGLAAEKREGLAQILEQSYRGPRAAQDAAVNE